MKNNKSTRLFSNLQSCFYYLYGLVQGSQSESLLLCILNRIICIRDDQTVRLVILKRKLRFIFSTFSDSYLRLIDECIQRIVFSKTACDPDFDTYSMDSKSTEDSDTDSVHDLPQMDEQHTKDNLQAAENQIQLDLMKERIEHLERTREKLTKALETLLTKVTNQTVKIIDF